MTEPQQQQAAATAENPLLAAKPPATDYLTYLTLIECHLTAEQLPTLHEVLQDTELTAHIGWDLVQLLLPLLPASEECLKDVARLGNPREVVLKVTEALRLIPWDSLKDVDSDEEGEEETEEEVNKGTKAGQDDAAKAAASADPAKTAADAPAEEKASVRPLPVQQFQVLLSMLAVLHSRIKTKFPSRFLSTSLQAVLASYEAGGTHAVELTAAVIAFVKTLSGTRRPHLPPRTSSSAVLTVAGRTAEDPEAQQEPPSEEERTLHRRLLQSFITHVFEDFLLSLNHARDIPAMSWASRLQEKFDPARVVPGRPTFADQFAKEEDLQARIEIVGQIVALARDLELDSKELIAAATDTSNEPAGLPSEEDDPPAKPEDIPLSKTGALFLLAARKVSQQLLDGPDSGVELRIFPEHATILRVFIGAEPSDVAGNQDEAILDSILALGLIALDENAIGEPESDEDFVRYLQTMSLIAANTPSPSLRYHAHYIASTVLRSHPSDVVRLTFIRDTLEHCPYENLKATAVGWLKGETLEANMSAIPTHSHTHSHETSTSSTSSAAAEAPPTPSTDAGDAPSIFATPIALRSCAPFLFPSLTDILPPGLDPGSLTYPPSQPESGTATPASDGDGGSSSLPLGSPSLHLHHVPPILAEPFQHFRANVPFYLATLNFYALLLHARDLHAPLDVPGLHAAADVAGSFLAPLRRAVDVFDADLTAEGELWAWLGGSEEGEEGVGVVEAKAEVGLVRHVLGGVVEGVKGLSSQTETRGAA